MNEKPLIIISAINLFCGGTLTILNESVEAFLDSYGSEYRFLALVHKKHVFSPSHPNLKVKQFPKSRKSYIYRIYYEYVYFWFYSRKLKPYLWLSLHDMTPNVVATKRVVYCHNPSPFYKTTKQERKLSPSFSLFNKFYGYLYGINIKKNDAVIVQQEWLRFAFKKRYGVERVIVAHPGTDKITSRQNTLPIDSSRQAHFIYPSLPRVFKNFEVIGKSVELLENQGITNFKVSITIDGTEDPYSNYIKDRFGHLKHLEFIGLQNKKEMKELYESASCLIFPSKLETWGLPITEAKSFDLPILLTDLPYAHETLGSYDKVKFFEQNDATHLTQLMKQVIENEMEWDSAFAKAPQQPFASNWKELFELIIS